MTKKHIISHKTLLDYYGREKMRKNSLIGRIEEINLLEEYYNSSKSELVAVYGRRRVGKTYLICETLGDRFDFEYTGKHKIAAKVQVGEFQKELNKLTKDKVLEKIIKDLNLISL